MSEEISKAGFQHVVMEGPSEETRAELTRRFEGIDPKELGKIYVPEVFMGVLARTALPSLIEALQNWTPDLVIREPTEFAGLVAAEKLGIRHVRMEILNGESEEAIATKYHEQLDALRALVDLPPEGPGYIKDELSFSAHPKALDDTPRINTRTPIRFNDGTMATTKIGASSEWKPSDELPLIYATFGTVAAGVEDSRFIYNVACEAFAGRR